MVFFGLARRAARGNLEFEPMRPGIEIHRLYGGLGQGRDSDGAVMAQAGKSGPSNDGAGKDEPAAAVLRYAPGASLPYHVHPGHEHIYILDGAQVDERGVYGPGTLVVNPPGSGHSVSSPRGCLVLVFWERPVEYRSQP